MEQSGSLHSIRWRHCAAYDGSDPVPGGVSRRRLLFGVAAASAGVLSGCATPSAPKAAPAALNLGPTAGD